MDRTSVHKRILAAQEILQRGTIDAASLSSLKTLLSGINPRLDSALIGVDKAAKSALHLEKGQAVDLVIEHIPEVTPQDKKRKKAVLFFLKFWKDLNAEVERVQKELEDFGNKSIGDKAGAMGAVFGVAKGPLGVITLIAVAAVALKTTEVSVVIKNIGCDTLVPPQNISINIPGLKLPNESITNGAEVTAKLPPFTVLIDATQTTRVQVGMFGARYSFDTRDTNIEYVFDGKVLNATSTQINLGDRKNHTLEVRCI